MRAAPLLRATGHATGWLTRAVGLLVGGAIGALVFVLVVEATVGPVTRSASGALSFEVVVPDAEELAPLAQRSEVYGPDGVRLATLHGEINREHISLDDVDEPVWRAILAAEDRRFFDHEGYDVEGISRAAVSNFQAGAITQGGSTITQQLAKAAVGDEQTLDRKIAELFQAMALEKEFNKEELLERYLNQVYFGGGAYGIAAAAEEFFATDATELRVEQAALLAGMIRSPARLDPRRNPDASLQRRNMVLAGMAEEGWLTPEEAARLQRLPLGVVAQRENAAREPYIVEAVKQEFFSNPAFGETRDERVRSLFTDGLRITTTIDPELQDTAERLIRAHYPERDGVTASIAAVDPRDGRVLAAAFGRDFDAEQFNLALQGRRQPGSAYKPFVMATALERGLPPDLPVEGQNRTRMGHGVIDDHEHWITEGVRNYGDASYSNLDMTEAMYRSVNTAFAQLMLLVGVDSVMELTERLGINPAAYGGVRNPSIALGGLARGVSPVEMASAYGAFATLGTHVRPHVIERVEDASGEVIYEADPDGEEAVQPAVAAEMLNVLRGVVTEGTGRAAAIDGWPVAGKTGTTQRNRDVWFVGFTPVLSTAVWIGHPDEDVVLHGFSSSQTAAPLWREFMVQALRDEEPSDYPEPDSRSIAVDGDDDTDVPDVVGSPEPSARSQLATAGLVAEPVRTHSSAPSGTVVWQSPEGGSSVQFGDVVRIGVSIGPAPQAPPPAPEPEDDDLDPDPPEEHDDDGEPETPGNGGDDGDGNGGGTSNGNGNGDGNGNGNGNGDGNGGED